MPNIVAFSGRWQSVGGQLLASGVFMASGHQDLGLPARVGAAFSFFMALAFGVSALATAISARLWLRNLLNPTLVDSAEDLAVASYFRAHTMKSAMFHCPSTDLS
jgi:hypothetical protein